MQRLCQRSLNHKMKANHNTDENVNWYHNTVSKIVKSQNESKSQQFGYMENEDLNCVKDR